MGPKLVEWLMRGGFFLRYGKNFLFIFIVMLVAQPLLHVLAQHFGWGIAPEKPFTSAAFWLNCVGVSLGSSLVSAFMLGTRQRDRR